MYLATYRTEPTHAGMSEGVYLGRARRKWYARGIGMGLIVVLMCLENRGQHHAGQP